MTTSRPRARARRRASRSRLHRRPSLLPAPGLALPRWALPIASFFAGRSGGLHRRAHRLRPLQVDARGSADCGTARPPPGARALPRVRAAVRRARPHARPPRLRRGLPAGAPGPSARPAVQPAPRAPADSPRRSAPVRAPLGAAVLLQPRRRPRHAEPDPRPRLRSLSRRARRSRAEHRQERSWGASITARRRVSPRGARAATRMWRGATRHARESSHT